jgi:hypothetical protein
MRPSAAIAILSLLPLSAAMADVYRSTDAQGHVLYSDTPSPGAQLIRTGGKQLSVVATAPAAAPSKSQDSRPPPSSSEQQAATRAVQNDVAQTRAEQCKKAQDDYQKAIQARRIYSEGPNGERTYLSDEDADKNRVAAKVQLDELCKDAASGAAQ